jgi:hypothetical protein
LDARRLAQQRMRRRRRRAVVLLLLITAVVAVVINVLHGGTGDPKTATVAHQAHDAQSSRPVTHRASASPSTAPSAAAATVSYPKDGSGQFTVATGQTGVAGTGGTLLRFQVAVEKDISNLNVSQFAGAVVTTLSDPRSWTAGGDWRFQRVGPDQPHDFTLYLVTPGTRDKMCHDVPDGYTSCRFEDSVVVNVSRWEHAVPFITNLDQYREYAINHEVGHRLGHSHELCPGTGQPAPVMQQQTLGLHGCTFNPWPYLNGQRYAGQLGDYSQANIPTDPPSYYRQ